MAKQPRVKVPKSANKGDMVENKTLAHHPMHSGNTKDKKGNPIPRMIINTFQATFNGKEFFSANLQPSVSADPYIVFNARAEESGTFEFTWTDDNGDKMTVSKDMSLLR